MNAQIIKNTKEEYPVHPKRFMLWLFIVSIIMMFGGLTSGYIVRRAAGNWLTFDLPEMFTYTTGIILLSSITIFWAVRAAKKDELAQVKIALGLTFLLGVLFLAGQYVAFKQLTENGIYFSSDVVSGTFVYVLAGLHAVHIVGGLIYLLVVLGNSFQYKIHSKNLTRISMCATYWHFVDGLWIYLFLFMLYNR